MLAYLTYENAFIRSYANRSLLLIFLCALTRTATGSGNGSFLGVALPLDPGNVAAFGPPLALLMLIASKIESDNLHLARLAVLEEASKLPRVKRPKFWILVLFALPLAAGAFMLVQFVGNLVPADNVGCSYPRVSHFIDLKHPGGTPSIWCIGDQTKNSPWIYPPFQAWTYCVCLALGSRLTYDIARTWGRARGNGK